MYTAHPYVSAEGVHRLILGPIDPPFRCFQYLRARPPTASAGVPRDAVPGGEPGEFGVGFLGVRAPGEGAPLPVQAGEHAVLLVGVV